MTSAGIEKATFRFVAQHLNHCATAVPLRERISSKCGWSVSEWLKFVLFDAAVIQNTTSLFITLQTCLSHLPFTSSLHEFYLGRGQFRTKRASLIIFTSHFIRILGYKDTLSDVFVPKFVRRKRRIHKFTTRRFTVLGKRATSLATVNCEPFGKLRCSLRSLGRKQKQRELHANTTNSCRLWYTLLETGTLADISVPAQLQ